MQTLEATRFLFLVLQLQMQLTMKEKTTQLFLAIALILGCCLTSQGCHDADSTITAVNDAAADRVDALTASKQCSYQGQLYDDQTEFPAGDGCNRCFCNPLGNTPGQVGCSGVFCGGLIDAGSDAGDAQLDSR